MANREYLIQVDQNGYVYAYNQGQAHSVSVQKARGVTKYDLSKDIQRIQKNVMVIHNHPSGGNFSGADLINASVLKNTTGVVATGSKGATFTFRKGTHFRSEAFQRGLAKATLRGQDYTHAVNNWLTANQKRYGYKYTTEGYVNPSRSKKK